ncbi:MAG: hypothetical protein N2315_01590 [Thermanaerothrix sp.]|nr:hypothetical protein [Thermanaerothrix sp.]
MGGSKRGLQEGIDIFSNHITDSWDNINGLFDNIDINSNKLSSTVPKHNEKLIKIIINTINKIQLMLLDVLVNF